MEKILRKVNCSERLPIVGKTYFVITKSGYINVLEYYPNENAWITVYDNKVLAPEYWYEEVALDSKIETMAKQYANGHKNESEIENAFTSGYICNRIYNEESAKERYEKALNSLKDEDLFPNNCVIEKALKLAAGIEK